MNNIKRGDTAVMIGFRFGKASHDINRSNYMFNSKGDGWFRKNEGPADGYGLCINYIENNSRQPEKVGDFLCYKVKIDYTSNDYDCTGMIDKFWLFIRNDYNITDVFEYIRNHKYAWHP